jgi:hypothetical protein
MADLHVSEDGELPPPTLPAELVVSLRGFADESSAQSCGRSVLGTLNPISRIINLERLDGVTVAFDYDSALAQLDRGYAGGKALMRTQTKELVGVAMTPAVLRSGVVKAHIVLHAPVALQLENEEAEEFNIALAVLAHECGHVEDLKLRDECFPGSILQETITDQQDALLEPTASMLWEEYAACRLSAHFCVQQTAMFEQSFTSVLSVARPNAYRAIRSYRLHRDITRVLEEAGNPLCEPLRTAAYLQGHLDGLGIDFDSVPVTRDQLAGSPYSKAVASLHDALGNLWSRRGQWASRAEFNVLKTIVNDVLADGGIVLRRLPDGRLWADIPFTRETMPF